MKWDNHAYAKHGQEPRSWTCQVAGLKIIVSRHKDYDPNDWLLWCDPWFNQVVLGNGTADEAKALAGSMVRKKLLAALEALK